MDRIFERAMAEAYPGYLPDYLASQEAASAVEEPAMSAQIHQLKLVQVGEGFRLDSDELLEAAKGEKWTQLAIVGELDGVPVIRSISNLGQTLLLIERAKMRLLAE